jgi:hypothetical protein
MIEVYGGRVSREQGELEVVRGGHGAPQGVLVDVADLEILEEPASPTLFRRHFSLLRSLVVLGAWQPRCPTSLSCQPA